MDGIQLLVYFGSVTFGYFILIERRLSKIEERLKEFERRMDKIESRT
jgi:hypothetical protein